MALLPVAAAAGCASPKLVDTGAVAVVQPASLPPPSAADLTIGARPQLLGPGDTIAVEVFGIAELSRQVRVDAGGNIALPLAGNINVIGNTPDQLAQVIGGRLRANHVKEPMVTVGVLEVVSQIVTLDGEVQRPGVYPVIGPMTLMRAIARAEGTSDIAQASHVVVFRKVDGRSMAALYDLRAIRLAAYEDPAIYPNDVIVVGESQARRLFPQAIQAASVLLSPLIAVLNNNN
ncbi:MAG TPA: polysaccharide biosynthesis/export family protein [Croceibacterium sp.]|nr:polysaccharide biosynthesis/export family protein [Croceibacterium sp.]